MEQKGSSLELHAGRQKSHKRNVYLHTADHDYSDIINNVEFSYCSIFLILNAEIKGL